MNYTLTMDEMMALADKEISLGNRFKKYFINNQEVITTGLAFMNGYYSAYNRVLHQ